MKSRRHEQARVGSTPISRTVELRVVAPVAAWLVSPLAWIVTSLDVVKDIGPSFGSCLVVLASSRSSQVM